MSSISEDTKNHDKSKKLVEACKQQDLSLVKKLISKGAHANFVHREEGVWGAYEKYSVLHIAITSLSIEDKRSFFRKFFVKQRSKEHKENVWRDIIHVLIKNGANTNETKASYDWRGSGNEKTAFELVCTQTKGPDADLLSSFLESGMNPDLARVQDIHTMRSDGHIKTYMLHDFPSSGNIDCLILLLNAGANIEIRATKDVSGESGYSEKKSETPLHLAASKNQLEICILLLANGADINAIQYHTRGNTPKEYTSIHLAIDNNNFNLAKFLLICNADSSIPYKEGDKSIKTEELLQWLIERTENLDEKTNSQPFNKALTNNLDLNDIITSMPMDFKGKIAKIFERIQKLGWNFNTNNFPEISKQLKSS